MDNTIRITAVVAAVVIVLCAVFFVAASPASPRLQARSPVYFFYGEECPHCHTVMPLVTNLSERYPEADIRMLEIWHNQTNQATYASVYTALKRPPSAVPAVVIGDVILVGDRDIPANMERLIREQLGR
jgi:thiol-disulfide isomerase/thioredoxin